MPGQESKKAVLWAHLLPFNLRGGPLAREQYQTEIQALQEVQQAQNVRPRGTLKHPISQQGVSFAKGGYTTPIGGYTGHSRDGKVRPDNVANVKTFKDHQGEFYINEPTVNLLGGVENVEKILAREAQLALRAPEPIPNTAGQNGGQLPLNPETQMGLGGQIPPITPPIEGKIPDGNFNRGFDGKVRTIENSYVVGGEVWNQAPHESGEGRVNPVNQFDYKKGMEKYGPGVYPITSYQMGGAITGPTHTRQGYQFGGYLPVGGDHDMQRKPVDPLEAGYQEDYQEGGSVSESIAASTDPFISSLQNAPPGVLQNIDPSKLAATVEGEAEKKDAFISGLKNAPPDVLKFIDPSKLTTDQAASLKIDTPPPAPLIDPTPIPITVAPPPPPGDFSLQVDTKQPELAAPIVMDPITIEDQEEPAAGKTPSNLYRDFGMQSLMDIAQGKSEYYENIINRTMQAHAGNAAAGEAALRQQLAQDGITGPAADALLRSYARNVRIEGDVLRGGLAGTILNEARGAANQLAVEGMNDLKFQESIRQFDVGSENWIKAFEQRVFEFTETHSLAVDNFERKEAWQLAGFLVDSGADGIVISDFMKKTFGLDVDLSHITTGQQMNRFGVAASGLATQIGQNITGGVETLRSDPEIKKWLDQMWINSGQDESAIGSDAYNDFADRSIKSMEGANNPINSILNVYAAMEEDELMGYFPGFTEFQGVGGKKGLLAALGSIIIAKEFGMDENGNYDVESMGPAWLAIFGPQSAEDVALANNIDTTTKDPGDTYTANGKEYVIKDDGTPELVTGVMKLPGYDEAKGTVGAVLIDKDNDKIYISKGDGRTFDEKSYSDIENTYIASGDPFAKSGEDYLKYIATPGTDAEAGYIDDVIANIIKDGNWDNLKNIPIGTGEPGWRDAYTKIWEAAREAAPDGPTTSKIWRGSGRNTYYNFSSTPTSGSVMEFPISPGSTIKGIYQITSGVSTRVVQVGAWYQAADARLQAVFAVDLKTGARVKIETRKDGSGVTITPA